MILCDRCQQDAYVENPNITSPKDALGHFRDLRRTATERCELLLLNSRNRVIQKEIVALGGLRSSIVKPRDIFTVALRHNAAGFILAHNHPSGDPTPSPEDRQVTTTLRDACLIMGIELVDHLVIARQGYVSLRDQGVI